LDRNELGAFLVQAGLGSARDHALASLLALNGLRISEASGADVEDLGFDRGHRTLRIVRKGRQARHHPAGTPDLPGAGSVPGGANGGPNFLGAQGGRMDRCAADRTVK
jgi:integrase